MDQATLKAECACVRADALDNLLEVADALVIKALAVPEVAQIARLEVRSRDILQVKWVARATQASETAGRAVANGATLSSALSQADKIMSSWKQDVTAPYLRNVASAYQLARIAGHKRVKGKLKSLQYSVVERLVEKASKNPTAVVRFDLLDQKAVKALQEQELMWIGSVYDGIAPTVRGGVKPALLAGLSKSEAGKMVSDALAKALKDVAIPDGFKGSSAKYFEGLAANAITNARVAGQIGSFSRLGVTKYEVVNPMDDRTTLICREMNGQVFYVSDAMSQLGDMQAASTPDQYKSAHPWLSLSKIQSLKSSGRGALTKAGQCFPPYHFECRSTVDISEVSASEAVAEG